MAVTGTLGYATGVTVRSRPATGRTARQPDGHDRTLEGPDEPVELLSELGREARDRPAATRATAPRLLAQHAVAVWGPQLEALDIPPEVVANAFETCQREIWLWVDGDRRWDQLAPHLAQRVARRS